MGKLRRDRTSRADDDLYGNKVTRFVTSQALWQRVLKYDATHAEPLDRNFTHAMVRGFRERGRE